MSKDMPDYIDRKKLFEDLNTFAPEYYNALINMLMEKQPSVDVVPRSEYERVKGVLDNTIKTYADCMKKYAEDIFSEIEEYFGIYECAIFLTRNNFAKLKKKYMEDGHEIGLD